MPRKDEPPPEPANQNDCGLKPVGSWTGWWLLMRLLCWATRNNR
jgi:hypothetical protein